MKRLIALIALLLVLVGCSSNPTPTTTPPTDETPGDVTTLPAPTDEGDTDFDDDDQPSDDSDYDDPTYLEGTYVFEADKFYIVFNQDMTAEVTILDGKTTVPYRIDDDDVYLDFSSQEGVQVFDLSHLEANDDFTELERSGDSEMVFKKQ